MTKVHPDRPSLFEGLASNSQESKWQKETESSMDSNNDEKSIGKPVQNIKTKKLRISFRCSLLSSMLILILSPVLILLMLTLAFILVTSNDVEHSILKESILRADEYVSEYLSLCMRTAQQQAKAIQDGYYMWQGSVASLNSTGVPFNSITNYFQIFHRLSQQHAMYKDKIFLFDYTTVTGDYVFVDTIQSNSSHSFDIYEPNQELVYVFNSNSTTTNSNGYYFTKDGRFQVAYENNPYTFWVVSDEHFYQLSLQVEEALVPMTSQAQGSSLEDRIYLCYQKSIYSKSYPYYYLGVTSVNMVVRELAEFAKSFKVSSNGFVAIMEVSDLTVDGQPATELQKRLIAYKDYNQIATEDEIDPTGYRLLNSSEIPDTLLRYVVNLVLPTTLKEYTSKSKETITRFYFNQKSYVSAHTIVSTTRDLNLQWVVFVVAPEIGKY